MKITLNKGEVIVREDKLVELISTKNSYEKELVDLTNLLNKVSLEYEVGSNKKLMDENKYLKNKLARRDEDLKMLTESFKQMESLYLETINKLKNKDKSLDLSNESREDKELLSKINKLKNKLDVRA